MEEAPSPNVAAEDFSYLLQRVPSAMTQLGTIPTGERPVAPNHSSHMRPTNRRWPTGVAMYAAVALRHANGRPPACAPPDHLACLPDDLWSIVDHVLSELDPPKPTGRKRIDPRGALDAIVFRLRSGCEWNRLRKEFPDDSSVHRNFQRRVTLGVFDRIWAVLLQACEGPGGRYWEWQAADGAMGKARMGGTW